MAGVLNISQALAILADGAWHNISYISANVNKNTGGEVIRIAQCKLETNKNLNHVKSNDIADSKAQNHYYNATRNVTLRNGLFRKFHIYLLFSIDNISIL